MHPNDGRVVSNFIMQALQNKDITIYGDGSQSRTFLHVRDNIEVIKKIFEEGLCLNDTINVGNDVEWSILDLAKLIIAETGSRSEIEFLDPLEEGDMTRRCPDISKMKGILGRDPLPLQEGIQSMIAQRS